MIGPFSSKTALSLLKAGSHSVLQTANKQNLQGTAAPLLEAMEKLDPERAGALKKQQGEAQNLIKQLGSSQSDASEQRKAAAAEKVQRIKEKLKALRLLATVNPKAAARQAAQLSRELAQATKEYANASGGGAAVLDAGGAVATVPAAAAGAENVRADAEKAADGENTDIAAAASTPAQGEEGAQPESAAEADETITKAEAQARPETVRQELEEIQKQKEEEERQGFREQIQGKIAEMNEALAKFRADSEFAKDVEEIKNALKSIIESAKKKLKAMRDPSAEQDIRSAENALREVEQSMSDISSAGISGTISAVNILV